MKREGRRKKRKSRGVAPPWFVVSRGSKGVSENRRVRRGNKGVMDRSSQVLRVDASRRFGVNERTVAKDIRCGKWRD